VEGHKHNFVSLIGSSCKLDLILTSELCQTVGDGLIFYLTYLFRSWKKHKICHLKFGKLLEILKCIFSTWQTNLASI
jgi:hypothetical protein